MLFSLITIIIGAMAALLGRHSVLGLCLGCGLMLIGWLNIERREARR